ncbi:hypothetical protein MHU86_19856 [Fragilaria crotonensis]|nr:hypothetical protein MHU86_19856 [Fragilaria crotonensis]
MGTVILDGQNPIAKVPIIVSGNQGTVFIDEIPRLPDLEGFAAGANNNNVDDNGGALQGLNARRLNMRILENNQISGDKLQNWMLQLQSGFMSLRRENVELRSEIAGIMQAMERDFKL